MTRPAPLRYAIMAMLLSSPFLLAADRMESGKAKPLEGTFLDYKGGLFHFQPAEGKKLSCARMSVKSLTLDPPAKASVKFAGKKKPDEIKFLRYDGSSFFFDREGQEIKFGPAEVSSIDASFDFSRAMTIEKEQENARNGATPGMEVDVESLVKTGTVTIIQFHLANIVASVRQGNFVKELAKESPGKIHLEVVDIGDFDSAVSRKYDLKSAPQFWFYSRAGKLVKKLSDRFTDDDITGALKEARK